MESSDKIFVTLSRMIKKSFLPKFRDWHETADHNEKRGITVLKYIMDTKGHKKADKTVFNNTKNVKDLLNQPFNLKDSEFFFRENQTTSAYQREFGKNKKSLAPQSNILRFKKIKNMEYNNWLEPLAVKFLDNWRELNDSHFVQDLVLKTLRSLNSRYRAHTTPETEFRVEYSNREVDWNLSMPIKFNQPGLVDVKKVDYNALFKQKLKRDQMHNELENLENN